ncbi:MAG TPA: universal stress protein [Candidatus Binatia bacterium]|nr:universal stress protein [Candidatus Binatia bacterium]
MTGLAKILVPVDFSEDSAEALQYAASLAEKTKAQLVALHVAQKRDADSFLEPLAVLEGAPASPQRAGIPVDRLLREKALDLYRFIEKVLGNSGKLKMARKVALGDKAEKIIETVKEENIDLLVLAVPRRSFFSHVASRGKLLRMISKCPCPVVVKPLFGQPSAPVLGRSPLTANV